MFVFPIEPRPYIRKTAADKFLWIPDSKRKNALSHDQRMRKERIEKLTAYMKALQVYALQNKYKLQGVLTVVFVVPMPQSWSQKKRDRMEWTEHEQTPDLDNYIKAFKDGLAYKNGGDEFVWMYRACVKVWGTEGKVIAFDNSDIDGVQKNKILAELRETIEDRS